jgi:hypothetical protein
MGKMRIAFLICCFVLSVTSPGKAQYQYQVEAKELEGIVVTTNIGDLVSGMLVELCSKGWRKRIAVTKTDRNGFFRFPHHPEGRYYLRISKKGYFTNKVIATLNKQSTAPLALIAEHK